MNTCPFCGTAWNGSKFCGECGKDLRQYPHEGSKTPPIDVAAELEIFETEMLPSGKYKVLGLRPQYINSITELTFPDCVEVIGAGAFKTDRLNQGRVPKYLTSVVIGNGVRMIEERAFCCCENLLSVTFGSSLQFIGEEAFAYCRVLRCVTIPQNVTKIENKAFYCCKNLTDITIEKGVQIIGVQAFETDLGSPQKKIRNLSDAICEARAFPIGAELIQESDPPSSNDGENGDSSAASDKKGFWQRFRRRKK